MEFLTIYDLLFRSKLISHLSVPASLASPREALYTVADLLPANRGGWSGRGTAGAIAPSTTCRVAANFTVIGRTPERNIYYGIKQFFYLFFNPNGCNVVKSYSIVTVSIFCIALSTSASTSKTLSTRSTCSKRGFVTGRLGRKIVQQSS